jgi:hypothetical protein
MYTDYGFVGLGPIYIRVVLRIQIRIRIHRIRMFLGNLDPDPDPLVRGMDPDPLSSSTKKIVRKPLIPTVLRLLSDFLSLKNDLNVPF